jgi:hypothetical protein
MNRLNILCTLTAYPPYVGGAQLLMHQLARELIQRHTLSVASQWDANRTDWLMGTTLRGPLQTRRYSVDGVPVCAGLRCRPPRAGGWRRGCMRTTPLQGPALARIASELARELAPLAAEADLIHNCRIGREGLSFASLQVRAGRGPYHLS